LCDSNSERILQKPFQQVLQEYITVSWFLLLHSPVH
jgi:hypothetical protein